MFVCCVSVCATRDFFGLVNLMLSLIVLYFIVFRLFLLKFVVNTYHVASWSDPYSSSDEEEEICRYRNTHQQRTKRCGNGQQQQQQQQQQRCQDSWTWEDVLARVATHARRSRLEGIAYHGNRCRHLGEQRQPERGASDTREHGWQGSPRGSPKNVLGEAECGEFR